MSRHFSSTSFRNGVRLSIPLVLSVFAYGVVYGVLAGQAGLTPWQATCMSGVVFAGSVQFVILDMLADFGPQGWAAPAAILSIAITTLAVNLRHVLMAMALHPWMRHVPARQAYPMLFLLNDESWALTLTRLHAEADDLGFYLGSCTAIWITWVAASATGGVIGSAIGDPAAWGLDFAFVAVFLSLLVFVWRGREDAAPWVVAGGAALLAARLLPGKWYIIAGGLAGSLAGGVLQARREPQ